MKRRLYRWAAMRCWRLHEVLSDAFVWLLSRIARAAWWFEKRRHR